MGGQVVAVVGVGSELYQAKRTRVDSLFMYYIE